jgi:hypothetical protein
MLTARIAECADCVKPVHIGSRGPSQRVFCEDCRRRRRAARRQAKSRVLVPIGRSVACETCSTPFITTRGAPTRCVPCRKDRRRRSDRDARRELRATNPAYRINDVLKVQIRKSLKGTKKGRAWEALVGYRLADLMAHLERQFLPGMTWHNHGDWHIDHIRPLCSFDFQTPDCPQFREAWALTNLRPLWAGDNIRKGGRRDLLL